MIEARKGCIKGIRYDGYCDTHNKQFKHCDHGLEEAYGEFISKLTPNLHSIIWTAGARARGRAIDGGYNPRSKKGKEMIGKYELEFLNDQLRKRAGIDPQKEET